MEKKAVTSQAAVNRRPYLDAYRALACLLVFFYHSALNLQAGRIVFFGYNGVHLFFVLSGYLLGGKLLERLSSGDRWWTIFIYLRHRFLRIYPAYFICLCVFVLLRHFSGTNAPTVLDFLSRVGLYFNYLDMTDLFAIHAALWTLAVEIQFYLVLPIASLLALSLFKDWKQATVGLGIIFVLVGLISRSYEILFVNHWWPSVTIVRFKWVFSYLDLFGVGILLYSAERVMRARLGSLKLGWAVGLVVLSLFALAATSLWAKGSGIDWQNAHDAVFMIVAPVITCVAFALLIGCTGLSRLQELPVFHWKWLQWIGKISYSVYLYHIGVLFAVNRLLDPMSRGIDWTTSCIIIAAVSLPFTLAVAWLSYVFVEEPFIRGDPLAEYRRIFGGWRRKAG